MESILTSIKKLLGIEHDYEHFDKDIIMHINAALMTLNQLGVGPKEGFLITGDTETWDRFLGGFNNLEAVKTYVYLKVRMVFDPPSSSVMESLKRQADEYEWRLLTQSEFVNKEV